MRTGSIAAVAPGDLGLDPPVVEDRAELDQPAFPLVAGDLGAVQLGQPVGDPAEEEPAELAVLDRPHHLVPEDDGQVGVVLAEPLVRLDARLVGVPGPARGRPCSARRSTIPEPTSRVSRLRTAVGVTPSRSAISATVSGPWRRIRSSASRQELRREFHYALRRPAHAGRDRLVHRRCPHPPDASWSPAGDWPTSSWLGPWQADDLVERGAIGPSAASLATAAGGAHWRRPEAAAADRGAGRRVLTAGRRGFRLASGRACHPRSRPEPAPTMWPAAVPVVLGGAGDRHPGGPGRAVSGLGPGRARLVRRLPGARAGPADGPLAATDYVGGAKPTGSARLIEAPRPRLKAHPAAAARRGPGPIPRTTPRTASAPAGRSGPSSRPHAGRDVVLKIDLRDFFPSIAAARVVALFRTAGYPEPWPGSWPASAPTGAPSRLWRRPDAPTPAPTPGGPASSTGPAPPAAGGPDLAGAGQPLRLSARLPARRPRRLGRGHYTRYADDLAFSGGPASPGRSPGSSPSPARSRWRRDSRSSTGRPA